MENTQVEGTKSVQQNHPYTKANVISKIFFLWVLPLFYKGFRTDLNEDDILPSLRSHDSKKLADKFEKEWTKELKKKKNPSLWWALGRVFGKNLVILGFLYFFMEMCAKLSQPIALSKLLEYYQPDSTMSQNEAYIYATLIVLSSLVYILCQHTFMLHALHLGMMIRVAASTTLYRKALKLNKSALAGTTIGQMVNLISNDVTRFEMMIMHIHNLWLAPIQTIVVLLLLSFYVGWTGVLGVVLMLAFVPFQMWMAKKSSAYRLSTALKTDERIRLMNEIISGIQVIKMYTWEKPFAKLVEISRRTELGEIGKTSVIRAFVMSLFMFLNRASIYFCMMSYVLLGKTLDPHYVFVTTCFYGILNVSVAIYWPTGITQMAEAAISVKRIKRFLLYDEVTFDSSSSFLNDFNNSANAPVGIHMDNVSVTWVKKSNTNILNNISMDATSGQLAAVIGPVGSGKTTLLHAILKELLPVSGTARIQGRISYASQEPWVFVGSVRDNITFGQEFNVERYNEVVKVCALERDFTLFPYGDRTIVGERGVSLSGGQKARINLARAVYKEADIYLLDDPLSAVDTHVGRLLFDECIAGYLKRKCVVLVTHQLQYLKTLESIYLLDNGKIEHSGSYEQIKNSRTDFTNLLGELKDVIDDPEDVAIEQKRASGVKTSTAEIDSKNEKNPTEGKEGQGRGTVNWSVYKTYILSGGNGCTIFLVLLTFLLAQAFASFGDYFLTYWVNMEQIIKDRNPESSPKLDLYSEALYSWDNSTVQLNNLEQFWLDNVGEHTALIAYSCLIAVAIVITIVRSLWFFRCCMKASIKLHNTMFGKIVYAAMRFFHVNPSGRILNRFSKDMNVIDEYLPSMFVDTMQYGVNVIAAFAVVSIVNFWMLIPAIVLLVIFYYIRFIYLRTSRNIKRLEGIARSPVYSQLTTSLQGLTTIRAFGAQEILKKDFDGYQNEYSSVFFMYLAASRCFGLWLDFQCVIFIAIVTFCFLILNRETYAANVGLAITQSITLIGTLQYAARQWSELENTMTCVERVKEYADVMPEKDEGRVKPARTWPENGNIKFQNLSLRYAPSEPKVLNDMSFEIKSKEKVGIVGRTGAGKSSIIAALFRLADIEGNIFIDGLNTKSISLDKLRSNISIIPQEPVLFSGSLKKNLDPFGEYDDNVLWSALEEVELKPAVSKLSQGLETIMSEGGSNFSVGQRQLVCLARAIIRNNKILVLDEATANVDPQTDLLIQSTIRKKFSQCTVLTVAHRLHTIMDSDKVLVMDAGRVVEFGPPHELLQNKKTGVLYQMVLQTGKSMADNLISIAEESYRTRQGVEYQGSR
ncbi:probable multidrug resistance-associated protein lethal(2)03659 [Cylas formicarius]|uniref:probable multidrug resistance-associated protein lethal(2)03659 n=1 Tax=Cylas formicarius TaxID=197179 RepID=UPI002958BCF7|nr:probable multidrug resistance-associated protein lethal(2)03659 [Cylas formicarius]